MKQQYVIIDTRKSGDVFTDILSENTARNDAINAFEFAWDCLTPEERRESNMTLAYIAVEGDRIITSDDDEYQEALDNGWETYAGYDPIAEH